MQLPPTTSSTSRPWKGERMKVMAPAGELRQVSGPSALGGGWRRFFALLWLIAVNRFKVSYTGTVIGYVWSLVRPLLLFGVLLFVFQQIFRFGNQIQNYPVLLLFNIMLFTFFSESTQQALTSVVAEEGVVRKMQFPRLAIPLASVLTSVFNLALNLIAVFLFILAYGVGPYWTWLLLPVLLLPLLMITSAVAAILSALYVRYRDMFVIWSVVGTALFYATPVLYTIDIVPDKFRWLILLNPLTPIFLAAREWIIDPTAPGPVDAAGGVPALMPAVGMFVFVCLLAVWVFNREAPRMAEEL
jgi:ABC-2 type transport system permease protein